MCSLKLFLPCVANKFRSAKLIKTLSGEAECQLTNNSGVERAVTSVATDSQAKPIPGPPKAPFPEYLLNRSEKMKAHNVESDSKPPPKLNYSDQLLPLSIQISYWQLCISPLLDISLQGRRREAPNLSVCIDRENCEEVLPKDGDILHWPGNLLGNTSNRRIQSNLTGKFVGNTSNRRIQSNLTGKFVGNTSNRRIQSTLTGKFMGNALNRRIQSTLTGKFVGNALNRRIQSTLTGKCVGNIFNRRIQSTLAGKFVGNTFNRRIQFTLAGNLWEILPIVGYSWIIDWFC